MRYAELGSMTQYLDRMKNFPKHVKGTLNKIPLSRKYNLSPRTEDKIIQSLSLSIFATGFTGFYFLKDLSETYGPEIGSLITTSIMISPVVPAVILAIRRGLREASYWQKFK